MRAYRRPLEQSARALAAGTRRRDCDVVLLGSIASPKYVDVLLAIFGDRLLFPIEFVGRGDMSRGGLLLRQAADGVELDYVPVAGAVLHGARPPKLPPLRRVAEGGGSSGRVRSRHLEMHRLVIPRDQDNVVLTVDEGSPAHQPPQAVLAGARADQGRPAAVLRRRRRRAAAALQRSARW